MTKKQRGQIRREEIYDDGTEEVVSDEDDMNEFSNKDVEYDKDSTSVRESYTVGGSGEGPDSDSGSNIEGCVEGEMLFDYESFDEDSDGFYNNDDEDVEEQKKRFASLNKNALNFNVAKGMSDGTMFFNVVSLGDTIWYNSVNNMKVSLEMMYEKSKHIAPFFC